MNCIVVLLAVFLVAVSADDQKNNCRKVFRPENFRCCTKHRITPLTLEGIYTPEDFKECWDIQVRPPSCARDECIGKKIGYYKDGQIDTEILKKIVEKNTEKDPELQTLIKDKCLKADTDISEYGKPDMCGLAKIKDCFMTQALKQCSQWSDQDNCQEVKKSVEECSSIV